MSTGIYAYLDNINKYYAYIGKDSNINLNKRHNEHKKPSMYDDQVINRILQNNPNRYQYRILMKGNYNEKQLNKMEQFCIKHLKTYHYDYPNKSVFNFTKGGDGLKGFKVSEETKHKLSELNKGKNHPQWKDYPTIHKSGIHRGKQNYCINYNGKEIKWSTDRNKLESFLNEHYTTIISEKEIKIKSQYKIIKDGKDNNKQRYAIVYNGKRLKVSIYIKKLEQWFENNYPNEVLII